jgi:hypothetical protein
VRDVRYVHDVLVALFETADMRNMDTLCKFHENASFELKYDIGMWIRYNTFILPNEKWWKRLDYKDMWVMNAKKISYGLRKDNFDWYSKFMMECSVQQELEDNWYETFYIEIENQLKYEVSSGGMPYYTLDPRRELADKMKVIRQLFDDAKKKALDNKDIKRVLMERKLRK